MNELYVLNTNTFEWKLVNTKNSPYDRSDFSWAKLDKIALLYGGVSCPSEIYYDDMWMFKYDDYDFSQDPKKEVTKDCWTEITQYV